MPDNNRNPSSVTFSQRMPQALHEAASRLAKSRGSNLTAYVNRAVEMAVHRDEVLSAPSPTSSAAEYELTIRFRIDDDGAADERALRLLGQAGATAELIGAYDVTTEAKRLAPMADAR